MQNLKWFFSIFAPYGAQYRKQRDPVALHAGEILGLQGVPPRSGADYPLNNEWMRYSRTYANGWRKIFDLSGANSCAGGTMYYHHPSYRADEGSGGQTQEAGHTRRCHTFGFVVQAD